MEYSFNKKIVLMAVISGLSLAPLIACAAPASGMGDGTTKGQINISLNVAAGCLVKPVSSASAEVTSPANGTQWMNLQFPPRDIGKDETSAQIDIECTAGAQPELTLDAGMYGGQSNQRNMKNTDGKSKLPYTLASDQAGKSVISPNQQVKVPPNGKYSIYALTNIPANTPTGNYADTVQATLSW
ncbi:hypothetical protein BTJ39_03930 [Izhakiella australiensis]|uniref:Spore coat protein U/FanG domain-containing protein n=2 Tax=Izhakiella australiensis TaxID=1926881 RepID=A0A1S8YQF0_9GAMM|nr:hypothetical protein BTJ39_03930 [Izhakiella australiensis]